MPYELTEEERPLEKSTLVINAAFDDEEDTPVAPNEISWKLTDEFGSQITGALGTITPSTSVDIVLSGDDLIITNTEKLTRLLYVETTYDSNLGSNLPLKDYVRFDIIPIRAIS